MQWLGNRLLPLGLGLFAGAFGRLCAARSATGLRRHLLRSRHPARSGMAGAGSSSSVQFRPCPGFEFGKQRVDFPWLKQQIEREPDGFIAQFVRLVAGNCR